MKSDVYSFGLVMKELFGDSVLKEERASVEYCQTVKELIDWMMEKEPKKRPTASQALSHRFFTIMNVQEFAHQTVGTRVPGFWKSTGLGHQQWLVNVHKEGNETIQIIQKLIDLTCETQWLGIGRDQKQGGKYSRLVVEKVDRLENVVQWKSYANERDVIRRKNRGQCQGVNDIKTIEIGRREKEVGEWMEMQELQSDVNEVLLFHGTPSSVVDIIKYQGLDHRATQNGGFFGNGIYFAENSSKSDQYTTSDQNGKFFMLLSRVCLGTPFVTNQAMQTLRRPPDNDATKLPFDSLLATTTASPQANQLGRYREFVVYLPSQCYCQYLIQYRRE